MKKKLNLAVALMLIIALLVPCAVADTTESALPQVGGEVNGFTVKSVSRFDLLGADLVLYEHEKTGALVLLVANDDTNRTFEMTFRTPTLDNKGIPHVFEHSTLDGSEKYPSKGLFFNLIYQTYNTYMNAFTMNKMTSYPVASLSEEQLLRYADYYTDSCLHPMIYDDESIFREEAWRYVLADPEDELTIAGTVYSEMMGATTLERAAGENYHRTLFPGSTVGNDHGGTPAVIPEMTWEDLKAYHDAYYHPSNSLTILYGKFEDPDAFLSLLDGYFSEYEKKEFVIEDALYTPITEAQEASFQFPVTAGTDVDHGAIIHYGFVCELDDEEDLNKLDMLTTLIGADSSLFTDNLKAALPGATASCYIDIESPVPAVYFEVTGVNPDEAQAVKQVVDDSLAQIAEEGFDQEAVDAIIASTRMDILLSRENDSVGTDMMPNIAYYWAATGSVFGYMDFIESLEQFGTYAEDGTFAALTGKYLVGNPLTALVITEPAPGLKEQEDAELAAKLAEIKAGMSEEEIAAIVEATNAEEEPEDTTEMVRQLQAVTVETLPEEAHIYEITDETGEDGIRRVHSLAELDGVGEALILLDASGLTQDQIHYFKLYTDLLGSLPTTEHSRKQLSDLSTRYLYNGSIRLSLLGTGEDGACTPYLRASFISMDEDLPAAYELVGELLFETDFTDVNALKGEVTSLRVGMNQSISSNIYNIQLYRALATADDSYAYYNYANFLEYYDFLCAVEAQLEEDPEAVISAIQAVQAQLCNRTNAISGFAGSAESEQANRAAADAFFAALGEGEIEPQTYDFGQIDPAEAIIVNGSVLYNMVFATYEDMEMEGYSGALDAVTSLVTDTFLYPMLRDQYGAYGVMHGATDYGVYLLSYRDPNLTETYEVFAQLPELVTTLADVDQETLDGYIQSAYAYYANSTGELTDAFAALITVLDGSAQEDTITYMQELKSITPEILAQYADMYAKLLEKGRISSSGSAALIEANADMFGTILNPLGVKDNSETELTDVAEGEWYYDAVRYAYENAMMTPVAEDAFGTEETVTLGEFAATLAAPVGGPADESAIAFLAQYGILPEDPAETELTREDLALYVCNYCYALGVPVEDAELTTADADAVDPEIAGYIGWVVENELIYVGEDGMLNPKAPATRADLAFVVYALFCE